MIRLLKEKRSNYEGQLKKIQADPINDGSKFEDYFDVPLKVICKQLQKIALQYYQYGEISTSDPSHGTNTISIQIMFGTILLVQVTVNTLHDEVTLFGDYAETSREMQLCLRAIDIVAKHVRV